MSRLLRIIIIALLIAIMLLASRRTGKDLLCNKASRFTMKEFKKYCVIMSKKNHDCEALTIETFCETTDD